MKRIAAIAAVVFALLAVPATAAMASTTHGGPQPPWRHPGPPGNCQPWGGGQYQYCQQQTITFNLRAWSSVATEVSGPGLSSGETVLYRGQFYTVGSVWHRHFTLDQNGSEFSNGAYPIWDGTATVLTRPWNFQNGQ
jgi:hypothetical protein